MWVRWLSVAAFLWESISENCLFESLSRLADMLPQQFDNKSLWLCISVVAAEKPGRTVPLLLGKQSLFPAHSTPTHLHSLLRSLILENCSLTTTDPCVFHLSILLEDTLSFLNLRTCVFHLFWKWARFYFLSISSFSVCLSCLSGAWLKCMLDFLILVSLCPSSFFPFLYCVLCDFLRSIF